MSASFLDLPDELLLNIAELSKADRSLPNLRLTSRKLASIAGEPMFAASTRLYVQLTSISLAAFQKICQEPNFSKNITEVCIIGGVEPGWAYLCTEIEREDYTNLTEMVDLEGKLEGFDPDTAGCVMANQRREHRTALKSLRQKLGELHILIRGLQSLPKLHQIRYIYEAERRERGINHPGTNYMRLLYGARDIHKSWWAGRDILVRIMARAWDKFNNLTSITLEQPEREERSSGPHLTVIAPQCDVFTGALARTTEIKILDYGNTVNLGAWSHFLTDARNVRSVSISFDSENTPYLRLQRSRLLAMVLKRCTWPQLESVCFESLKLLRGHRSLPELSKDQVYETDMLDSFLLDHKSTLRHVRLLNMFTAPSETREYFRADWPRDCANEFAHCIKSMRRNLNLTSAEIIVEGWGLSRSMVLMDSVGDDLHAASISLPTDPPIWSRRDFGPCVVKTETRQA
ncbi:hypothetical protein LTR66_005150 [Elasticomyces elasticus]|nr:hypothetical protein LTR66_005150 [Elasticomyces elasticus]